VVVIVSKQGGRQNGNSDKKSFLMPELQYRGRKIKNIQCDGQLDWIERHLGDLYSPCVQVFSETIN
jgi:hypothetical protein